MIYLLPFCLGPRPSTKNVTKFSFIFVSIYHILSGFDFFSLSNFSNSPLMTWTFRVKELLKRTILESMICLTQNVQLFSRNSSSVTSLSVSLWSRISESSPKLSKILAATKHYKKTFQFNQLLNSINSRFKTQTLKSSPTSCLFFATYHLKWLSLTPCITETNHVWE